MTVNNLHKWFTMFFSLHFFGSQGLDAPKTSAAPGPTSIPAVPTATELSKNRLRVIPLSFQLSGLIGFSFQCND